MNNEVLVATCRALLIKISIVTGWPMPEDQATRGVLYDQFSKKITEDYGNLNPSEIEYAIRQYGTKIKDWGKNINLSLIDEAITPYLIERKEVSEIEERCKPIAQIEAPIEPLNETEMTETAKKVYLSTRKVGLIPTVVYDILERTGEIALDLEEKEKIRAAVEQRLKNEAAQEGLQAIKDLRYMEANNRKGYEVKVRNECKRYAVADYFDRMDQIDNF